MFTNLKHKVEKVEGDDLKNLVPHVPSPAQLTTGKRTSSVVSLQGATSPTGLSSRQGSISSLQGIVMSPPSSPDGSKEIKETMGAVKKSDVENKKDKKLSVEELQQQVKRLEQSLEKQKEAVNKQVEKNKDDCKRKLEKKEDDWRKSFQENEASWQKRVSMLEKEKRVLEEEKRDVVRRKLSLEEALKVAEGYKEKIVQYQEDMDQLEGFQNQEIAKVKHLLLQTQQELKVSQNEGKEKEEALQQAQAKHNIMQAELEMFRGLESELNEMQDKHDALSHLLQQQKLQSSSLLQERDWELEHLRERLTILESRKQKHELSGDERVDALVKERDVLEQKLEESREQLTDIKTNWSEKISLLEKQISHLNMKIVEDSTEMHKLEEEKQSTIKKVILLEEKLEERTREGEQLKKDLKIEVDRWKSEKEVVEGKLMRLERETEIEREKTRERINCLEAEKTEYLEKEIEAEKKVSLLEEEVAQTREDIENQEKLVVRLTADLDCANTKFTDINDKLSKERLKFTNVYSEFDSTKRDLRETVKQQDELLLRNAELAQHLELLRQQVRSYEQEQAESESVIQTLKKENNELKSRLCDTEEQLVNLETNIEGRIENSARVAQLQSIITELENQLGEKNKTVRLLQQRLGDMKKTLQKELKMQVGTVDGSEVELGPNPMKNSVSPSLTRKNHQATNHRINNILDEDVNIKYLKHVIIKFLTSREYEAKQLTRAVATLLQFTPEEEKLLSETLEWKMSWFGTRPNLGTGQLAKTIPHSH